jgi:hypothetical protein
VGFPRRLWVRDSVVRQIAQQRHPQHARHWRSASIALIVFAAATVALATLFGPIAALGAKHLLVWATSDADVGSAVIEPGDRYAEAEFATRFSSAPVVTLTPENLVGSISFAAVRVDRNGFRLELAEPAPTKVSFSWTALWNVGFDLEDAADSGLPELFTADLGGTAFEVRVEAYRNDQPAALWVSNASMADLSAGDDAIAAAALAGARRMFDATFTCSWLDELRSRLYARVAPCPAWGPRSARPMRQWSDHGGWSTRRTDRGLEVALRDEPAAEPLARETVVAAWSELLRGSVAVDLSRHNNQVLDFVDALTAERVLDSTAKLTIIHFDTHSDLHAYPDPTVNTDREDISDFMNRLAADGRLAEVYWVLPEWTRDPEYRARYWEAGLPNESSAYVAGPKVLEIFADRAQRLLYFGSAPAVGPNIASVRFHKALLSELPDFTGRSDVYLEIDGDYFSNTGFDTDLQGHTNPTRDEMLANFATVAEALKARGVRPMIASWCLSPSYTALEDELDQERFFFEVLRAMPANDYLLGYRHLEADGAPPRARTVRRATSVGQLLLELREHDLRRPDADRRIELAGAELEDALQLTARLLDLDASRGRLLLQRLDRFDGRLDGVVDLVDAEYYAAIGDVDGLAADLVAPPGG